MSSELVIPILNKEKFMTDAIEEKKEIFNQKRQEYIDVYKKNENFIKRVNECRQNILALEEEREELKAKRPTMLAENEDISKLNQRLKDIDDEIEINKDTISGVEVKINEMNNPLVDARQNTNIAYQAYIDELLRNLRKEYMKVAPKLAEIIKDYVVLEDLRMGDGYGCCTFTTDEVNRLPNFKDSSNPLFEYNHYEIVSCDTDRVLKKYNMPNYNLRRIHLYEYKH